MISFTDDILPAVKRFEEFLGLSYKVFLFTALLVIILGIYVANLLFGEHSLRVLQNLKREKTIIKYNIDVLKHENAELHKKILEWSDA